MLLIIQELMYYQFKIQKIFKLILCIYFKRKSYMHLNDKLGMNIPKQPQLI